MKMIGSAKSTNGITFSALLPALVSALNPLEHDCVGLQGEQLCSVDYTLGVNCVEGEANEKCAQRWCDALRAEINEPFEHCGLSLPADESAAPARKLAPDVLDKSALEIKFSVKGWAQTVETNVRGKLPHVQHVVNSDIDFMDANNDGDFLRTDSNFSTLITDCNQTYCTNHEKSFKLNDDATTCRPANSANDDTVYTNFTSGTKLVVNDGTKFAIGDYIEVQGNSNDFVVQVEDVTSNDLTISNSGAWGTTIEAANSGNKVKNLGTYVVSEVKTVFSSASSLSLELPTGHGDRFANGDKVQIGEEILTLSNDHSSDVYTVARGSSGAVAHAVGATVTKLNSCRDTCCAKVSCPSDVCVAADQYVANSVSNPNCAYWDCANTNGLFKNDSACCDVAKATCNSLFRLNDGSGAGADEVPADGATDETTRKQCAEDEHVAFAFCNASPCVENTDRGTCCVKHNGTGSVFEKYTEVAVSSNFSSGTANCSTLTYANFFKHISDAIAKAVGVLPSDVVLVDMPDCPSARRLESNESWDKRSLEAVFRVKGEEARRLGDVRGSELREKAQAVFQSFVQSLL